MTNSVSGVQNMRTILQTLLCVAIICVALHATSWSIDWSNQYFAPGVDGTVNVVREIDGVLVVGGQFSLVDGKSANNIAKWDGNSWETFGNGVGDNSGNVNSVVSYRGGIVVGGTLRLEAGGDPVSMAMWDGAQWHSLSETLVSSAVYALAVFDTLLIAGGVFRLDSTSNLSLVIFWNGHSWAPLGEQVFERDWTGPHVRTLAIFKQELYAGGGFSIRGADTTYGIARWDGAKWRGVGGGLSGAFSSALCCLSTNDYLYVGGHFERAGGLGCPNTARWDGQSWQSLGGGLPGAYNASVRDLASWRGSIVAVGTFYSPGSNAPANVALFSGTQWSDLDPQLSYQWYRSYGSCSPYGQSLAIGGSFAVLGSTGVNNLGLWNGSDWQPLYGTPRGRGASARIRSLEKIDGYLVAGGEFETIGGTCANLVAKWDGDKWTGLGLSNKINGWVTDITSFEGKIYITGNLYNLRSDSNATVVARLDDTGWADLSDGLQYEVQLWSLHDHNGRLYGGGNYGLYILSGGNWIKLVEGKVNSLITYNNELFGAGSFLTQEDPYYHAVGRYDDDGWHKVGEGIGASTSMGSALFVYNGALVVGGDPLTWVGGKLAGGVAIWDGSSWNVMPINSYQTPSVKCFEEYQGKLFVGGIFFGEGNDTIRSIAYLQDSTWHSLQGGTRYGGVYSLSTSEAALNVAGEFDVAGEVPSAFIAQWGDIPLSFGDPEKDLIASAFSLQQNFPNPFNPVTTIQYSVPLRMQVTIDIFNVLGEKVRSLVDETKSAGSYRIEWAGTDDANRPVATGVYLYRLQAGDVVQTKKMLLIK